jgi:amidophosphoribosyltransferase
MCGVVGVIASNGAPVVREIANGAHFLQHRGQAYAGLFVLDPARRSFRLERGEGLADDIFKPLGSTSGDAGIAQTRYKTVGRGGRENAQPFHDALTGIALAHNGHVTNVEQIRTELAERGQTLVSDCDAEALLRVLALWFDHYRAAEPGAGERDVMFRAAAEVLERVTGAFSAVAVTRSGLYAFRDPHGFRPLALGRKTTPGAEFAMLASETIALEQNGYGEVEDVPRGAVLFLDRRLSCTRSVPLERAPMPCAFELVYFADVESSMWGERIRSYRWRAGKALAEFVLETAPELVGEIELVVPIPHSPIPGAEAFARTIERQLDTGVVQYATPVSKYRYGGRIFMEETQAARDEAAMLDLRLDAKAVEGKTVFLVDDSIVRGTNAAHVVAGLRRAGVRRVFLGTLWPMVIDSCFQGIDTPTQTELIGARFAGNSDSVRIALGADALFYLPEDRFRHRVIKDAPACMSCVNGRRAVRFAYPGTVLPPAA